MVLKIFYKFFGCFIHLFFFQHRKDESLGDRSISHIVQASEIVLLLYQAASAWFCPDFLREAIILAGTIFSMENEALVHTLQASLNREQEDQSLRELIPGETSLQDLRW